MNSKYRKIDTVEIELLKSNNCTAEDWDRIWVKDGFNPENIHHANFSGTVKMGVFNKVFILNGGMKLKSGIRHASIHNCKIGDDVLIDHIHCYMANYRIGNDCFIQNVNLIVVDKKNSFGNGIEVPVLNETGGREVAIFDNLSAHLAYIIALYRSEPKLIEKLKNMISEYSDNISSEYGKIGNNVRITGCGNITNVSIGDYAVLNGVSNLEDGSVNSNEKAPVTVGCNVTAKKFIISSGSSVTDGVTLSRCFVGQACNIGHLFSAHNSLFFSNCQAENGEVSSVFSGPYTVTMHKSSLLISGMFSFLNAGSGSNQSNHLYKLGPIHQGIVERGSKTTSDSYILWPARIGAFSLIMGRHVNHTDSSDLPFSYLIEKNNETYMIPGVNLRSVGTIRDAKKWPKRDKRTDSRRLDYINFNLLSPYTIQKMIRGINVLKRLQETSGENSAEYTYQSMHIKNSALKKGFKYYAAAINKFLGNSLIKRLENIVFKSNEEIRSRLRPEPEYSDGRGEWVDISGLFAPQQSIDKLIKKIISGEIDSLDTINAYFEELHKNYYDLEWTWAYDCILKWYGLEPENICVEDIIDIVTTWKDAVIGLDKLIYEDARKEFSMNAQVGFGADSCNKASDFEQVRGDFENNTFVSDVRKHIEEKRALGDELLKRCRNMQEDKADF